MVWNNCGSNTGRMYPKLCNEFETSSHQEWKSVPHIRMDTLRRSRMISQVHRCINNRARSYMVSKFFMNSTLGYSSTRGPTSCNLKRPLSNHYHSSFEFQGAKMFNSLPDIIRSLTSSLAFNVAVRNFDLNNSNVSLVSLLYMFLLFYFCWYFTVACTAVLFLYLFCLPTILLFFFLIMPDLYILKIYSLFRYSIPVSRIKN